MQSDLPRYRRPLRAARRLFYGSLNEKGNELALGDIAYGQVDVYSYKPAHVAYLYSFNKGLIQGDDVEAAVFAHKLLKKK